MNEENISVVAGEAAGNIELVEDIPKSERHTKHGAVTAESIRKKFLPGLDESYILLRHQLGKETYQATGEALTAFTAALDTWFKYIDKLFPVKKDQES